MNCAEASNILIFEPHANGHHGPYVQWMATGLVERGFKVTVVPLRESLAHPSMQMLGDASGGAKPGNLRRTALAESQCGDELIPLYSGLLRPRAPSTPAGPVVPPMKLRHFWDPLPGRLSGPAD